MTFENGDNAIAVRAGAGWALQPICTADPFSNALAVRAGAEWILTSSSCADNEPGDPPCTGQDPLCGDCACEAALANIYNVSITGFPAICDVDLFNGVWSLSWVSDCTWEYWIDEWRQVALMMSPGYAWTVHWSVAAPGGAGGYFGGSGGSACAPETHTYASESCFNPFGCFGLCAGVASASVLVSRG